MDLGQPLFPRNHIQQLPGDMPTDLGEVQTPEGEMHLHAHPGVEGDLARIEELGDKPDLYLTTYIVDGIVEALEGTTVRDLSDSSRILELIEYLDTFTKNKVLEEVKSELSTHRHEELSESFEAFILANREVIAKLRELEQEPSGDAIERFKQIQPALIRVAEAHQAFYLKFREM